MSETKFTDQRPRTTKTEIPEEMRAKSKLPKDPALVEFIERMREKFNRRVDDRRVGERRG